MELTNRWWIEQMTPRLIYHTTEEILRFQNKIFQETVIHEPIFGELKPVDIPGFEPILTLQDQIKAMVLEYNRKRYPRDSRKNK